MKKIILLNSTVKTVSEIVRRVFGIFLSILTLGYHFPALYFYSDEVRVASLASPSSLDILTSDFV